LFRQCNKDGEDLKKNLQILLYPDWQGAFIYFGG